MADSIARASDGPPPTVSVITCTFNQEAFIVQALESALAQETPFDFEIVVGEDCSADRTREILFDLARRAPGKIRLLLHERNQGFLAKGNYVSLLRAARGRYIAVLDGDDWWLSPQKLARQVEMLDARPELAICFHDAEVYYADGRRHPVNYTSPSQKPVSSIEDLFEANFIASCSVMFRRGLLGEIPAWFFDVPFGDWALYLLIAQHGLIGYIPEVLGAYRAHPGGIWSGMSRRQQFESVIAFLDTMDQNLGGCYRRSIAIAVSRTWFDLARFLADAGDRAGAREALQKSLLRCADNPKVPSTEIANLEHALLG